MFVGKLLNGETGSSIAALEELGRELEYTLVCSTGNAFFVRNDYVHKLKEHNDELTTEENSFKKLITNKNLLVQLIII